MALSGRPSRESPGENPALARTCHPNYISTLLPRQIGKTFSRLLLEQRMERAAALLKGTTLPVSQIAELLGYSNSSNFYKAFRAYYGVSPREYQRRSEPGARP